MKLRLTRKGSPLTRTLSRALALAAVAGALGGCETLSQVPQVDLVKAKPIDYSAQAVPTPTGSVTGSLFAAGQYRPGFEDPRARLPGDTLTIQITERVSASQQSSTEVNRESQLSTGVTVVPFLNQNILNNLNAGVTTNNTMAGDGTTSNSNTFSGSITATVTEVLPNGHLVVVGEKQIGVNQNVDVLQFSGTVDPRAIQPGNTVLSTRVANARVLSRGRGAQNDAQTFGWLSRFFLTLFPF